MSPPRLRAWAHSGLILALAGAMAVPVSYVGVFLVVSPKLEGREAVETRSFPVAVILVLAGLIATAGLVTRSVAIGSRGRVLSRWREWRAGVRTLMAAVGGFAILLGLLVFAQRSDQARRAARSHADSAQGYRWLQGLESESGRGFRGRFPASEPWTARQAEYLRAMEHYHRALSERYDAAVHHPWLSLPTHHAEPQLSGEEPSDFLVIYGKAPVADNAGR